MHRPFSLAALFVLLSQHHVEAAELTGDWRRDLFPHFMPQRIHSREQDLSFCYGEGSICAVGNDLFDDCESLSSNYDDLNPWYECLCSNGYVSVEDA